MIIEQVKRLVTKFPLEAVIWMSGLIALAFVDPSQTSHVTICPIAYFGFDFCPGCGLGRSIAWLFHGSVTKSLSAHPLGIVTLAVLIHRIIQLINNHVKSGINGEAD
ncbi:MAG: DUF2752 domain-containing protein [Chryseolinea sp.]